MYRYKKAQQHAAPKTLLRALGPPPQNRHGQPLLRHDPGYLPPDSLLIQKSIPGRRRPSLPSDRVADATPTHYGQHIYMYRNIHTNQVVYSLTRHLNNNASIKQLPFLGKKTVPARLRKDMWLPFCQAEFQSPHAGLEAYRKLREYRRLHETAYDRSIITETSGDHAGQLMTTKRRGKVLMDQKANSIADLAAVLLQQQDGPSQHRLEKAERRIKRVEKLKMQKGEDRVGKAPVDLGKELTGVEGVVVRWADPLDAEFAAQWPAEVLHEGLQRSRYTAAWPVVDRNVLREQVAQGSPA